MSEIKWSPYIPTYPNVQIPYIAKTSELRVVEPSTRASVKMYISESLQESFENFKKLQENAIVLRYTSDGRRILNTDSAVGNYLDITI